MGVVNLFIGGSGKYVAETLQGLQAHYELPLPPTVAFDLNAVDTQTGSFALDNLHSPHPDFAGAAQGEVAPKWQSLQPGLMPDPQTQMPGPKLRPETQLMQKIGGQVTFGQAPDFGLWGMRAHGLLAFAAFLRPDAPASEMGKQQEFKHFLTEVFQESAADGSAVTINMVASTAGGTGAGMFLPFAWWLKRCFPDVTNPRINLFLVTPSAFDNLSLSGAPMVSMRTKARTGTFAIFKELQLMEHADISEFPAGAFPINTGTGAKHLEYRLGDNIFNRTFWMGRRSQDNQAENFEAYAETELLVRILGDASAANEVNAFTGDEQQHRLLPSVVTIDYPRLQIARRESSRIAEQALEYLRTGEGVLPPQAGHRFFDFPAQDPSAFGTFIQDNKLKIFAPNQSGESPVAAQDLENLVGRLVAGVDADQLFRNVLRGSQRNQSGYLAPAADWAAYCEGLCQDLNAESQGINKKLSVSIDASLQAEAATFRKFLVDFTKEFLDPGDGARPFPISVLREQKKEITQDLAKVTKFFSGDFRARLPSVLAARPRFATQQTLEDRITRQEGRLRNPPRPFEPGGLSKWRWVALFFVSLMGGVGPYVWANWGQQLAWPLTSTDGLGWWTVVVPIVLTVGMFVLLRRGKTKLEQLRRKEEGTLFRLYQDSAYAHVVHTLWAQVGESFGAQAVSALATLDERVGELDEVYRTLFTRAQARATQVTKPSPQTVASIGLGSSVPQNQMAPLRDRLLDGVRVDLAKANDDTIVNFVLHVKGQADNPTKGNVKNIADDVQKADAAAAQTDQVGQTTGMRDLKDLDAAIDQKSTNECAEFLPQTFQAALSNEGGATVLYEHLATLVHRTVNGSVAPGYDRRRPSIDTPQDKPSFSRLYVPSQEVAGLVVGACEDGHMAPEVVSGIQAVIATGTPTILPALGEQIAILSLYPSVQDENHPTLSNSLMGADEGKDAFNAYYGIGEYDQNMIEGSYNEDNFEFHVIPEAAAAAPIELARPTRRPLWPCVAARLLGSQPGTGTETIVGLFYLLRAMGIISRQMPRASALELVETWSISGLTDANGVLPDVPLFDGPVTQPDVDGDNFGSGRGVVSTFDAFKDFMLYDGARLGAMGTADAKKFSTPPLGRIRTDDWNAMSNLELWRVQTAIVLAWRRCDDPEHPIEPIYDKQKAILQEDVALMGRAPAAEDWKDAVEVILRGDHKARMEMFRKWDSSQD